MDRRVMIRVDNKSDCCFGNFIHLHSQTIPFNVYYKVSFVSLLIPHLLAKYLINGVEKITGEVCEKDKSELKKV
ncbi:hypothetical protein DMA11_09325 [Marinilabiliaceae bacterium JC017]|nr:hypothetical protein DMA11_09325 [Marinilabiliaceae bacterium JC017]